MPKTETKKFTTAIEITKTLEKLADPKRAASSEWFFKTGPGEYGEGDTFRGIRVPDLRAIASKAGSLPLAESKKLLFSKFHEDRLLALLILVKLFANADEAAKNRIFDLYIKSTRAINNWDLVDSSAGYIVGSYLNRRDRGLLYRFASTGNLWERRIAIIATSHFIRSHDFADTIAIAEILLADKEDLIHKAVGWMLREVGNRSLPDELTFLDKHSPRMPRTMLRYAIEKFPEPLRRSYLGRTRTG